LADVFIAASSPPPLLQGEGEGNILGNVSPRVALSDSLTLGYDHVIPTGFQFSAKKERSW